MSITCADGPLASALVRCCSSTFVTQLDTHMVGTASLLPGWDEPIGTFGVVHIPVRVDGDRGGASFGGDQPCKHLLGQRPVVGSLIVPERAPSAMKRTVQRRSDSKTRFHEGTSAWEAAGIAERFRR